MTAARVTGSRSRTHDEGEVLTMAKKKSKKKGKKKK
jgi:hypothetical protein